MAESLCYPPEAITTLLISYGAQSLSCVQFFAAPWTVAHQVPLSMEFSSQKYWNGLPFATPGDLPKAGIEPSSPSLSGRFLPLCHLGSQVKLQVYSGYT